MRRCSFCGATDKKVTPMDDAPYFCSDCRPLRKTILESMRLQYQELVEEESRAAGALKNAENDLQEAMRKVDASRKAMLFICGSLDDKTARSETLH